MDKDEIRREIPEKFKASMDVSDERAYALLVESNKAQLEWAKSANSPFARQNPRDLMRAKAWTSIETLEKTELDDTLAEILAEKYALIGRFDLAAQTTRKNAEHYEKYWGALFIEDEAWCSHSAQHKYIKEYVFSIRHGQEMPMLACNICGIFNIADSPDELKAASAKRASIRDATAGMSQSAVKDFLNENVRPK